MQAFTSWVNSVLAERSLILDRDIDCAFDDGLMLIPLVEILTGGHCPKHTSKPTMRVHKLSNIELAFNMLESHQFHPDIHVEVCVVLCACVRARVRGRLCCADKDSLARFGKQEMADANSKMVLGFVWQLFCSYGSKDSASTADLLAWVQARVNDKARYPDVHVTEFSKSWQSGKAFAALVDSLSPNIFDFSRADLGDNDDAAHTKKRAMLDQVFASAETQLKVPQCLASEDICAFAPDDKSVKMYVTLLKNAWAEKEAEIAAAEAAREAARQAEAARRAAMTKEQALAELDAALAKLEKLKTCPQCHFDLSAWLAANP